MESAGGALLLASMQAVQSFRDPQLMSMQHTWCCHGHCKCDVCLQGVALALCLSSCHDKQGMLAIAG